MKRIVVAALLCACSCGAFADSKEALAKELVVITDTKKNVDKMYELIQNMQQRQLKSLNLQDAAAAAELQKKVMAKVMESLSWDAMEKDIINIMASTYTEDELKAIIAFYKTPAGKSMVAKQPVIAQKMMAMTQQRMQKLMPEVRKIVEEARAKKMQGAQPAPKVKKGK